MLVTIVLIMIALVLAVVGYAAVAIAGDQPTSVCTHCFMPIRWVSLDGRALAVDLDPRPYGNIELTYVGDEVYARWLTQRRRDQLELRIREANRTGDSLPLNLYTPHSCPRSRAVGHSNRKEGVR
jgi:hypothetical protein